MNSDNELVIYCGNDRENRVYWDVCDKLCIERFYKKSFEIQNSHK